LNFFLIAFSRRSRVRFDVEAKGNALSSLSATIAIMLLFNALNILLPFEPGVFLGLFLASARAARAARAIRYAAPLGDSLPFFAFFLADPTTG
tara:strand:- start:851 stop:1129 length:279 start_codon:yes stop_codon:yes gene_type:complete